MEKKEIVEGNEPRKGKSEKNKRKEAMKITEVKG